MLVGMPDPVAEPLRPRPLVPRHHRARLLDRNSFFDQLRRAVIRNEGIPGGLALLAVAPDPLTCEHSTVTWEMREEICLLTAGRLVGCLHYSHPTTRVGGDEFLVLAESIGAVDNAVHLAEQILFAVREPEIVRPGERSATASVGIALPEPRTSAEQLQNNAAVAMHLARTGGGNRLQVYGEWMEEAGVVASRAG
jgi:GGDEF domain-containing protein